MLPQIHDQEQKNFSYVKPKLSQKELFEIEVKAKTERIWKHKLDAPQSTDIFETDFIRNLKSLVPKTPSLKILIIGITNPSWIQELSISHQVVVIDSSLLGLHFINHITQHKITSFQKVCPFIGLEERYDLIICDRILEEIPSHLHRLCLSEFASLLSEQGECLLSVELDPKSYFPENHLKRLWITEFCLDKVIGKRYRLLKKYSQIVNSYHKMKLNPSSQNFFIKTYHTLLKSMGKKLIQLIEKYKNTLVFFNSFREKEGKFDFIILKGKKKKGISL